MLSSFENSFTPYIKFNEMIAKTSQTAINQHFNSIEKFTKIGMDNFYEGVNTRTLDDVVSFSKKQPELFKKTSELLVTESQAFAKLTSEVYESTQEIFSINLNDMYVKMPKVNTMQYDLGESIVIRKPKKKAASKAKKSPASTKSKTSSKKTADKAPIISKEAKPVAKVKSKTKTIVSKPPKSIEVKTVKAKSNKKPVAKSSAKNTSQNTQNTQNTKPSTSIKTNLKKATNPKAVKKNIKSKDTLAKQIPIDIATKSIKESVSNVLNTAVKMPEITANKVDEPAWDKPKSLKEDDINTEKKVLDVTSTITNSKASVKSKK